MSGDMRKKDEAMRDYRKIYIDGCWGEPQGGQVQTIINPATEAVAGEVSLAAPADVGRAGRAARRARRSF